MVIIIVYIYNHINGIMIWVVYNHTYYYLTISLSQPGHGRRAVRRRRRRSAPLHHGMPRWDARSCCSGPGNGNEGGIAGFFYPKQWWKWWGNDGKNGTMMGKMMGKWWKHDGKMMDKWMRNGNMMGKWYSPGRPLISLLIGNRFLGLQRRQEVAEGPQDTWGVLHP